MSAEPGERPRVLVVDDDRLIREIARDAIGDAARVECCESAEKALAALAREPADLVLSDLNLPGISGVDLLEEVSREHTGTDFVLLTARPSVESAVGALRMGAADYLTKPVRPDELRLVVDRILARRALLAENDRLRDELRAVESCRALLRCLDPGEVYAMALDLLLRTLDRRRGIAVFRRTSMPLSDGIVFRGLSEAETARLRPLLTLEKPFDFDSLEGQRELSEGPLHDALREAGVDAGPFLALPVRGPEAEAGVLSILGEQRPFDPSELERARIVAGHAELALGNAERYLRAKERAFIDDVTEVYNARFLLQATDHEIQRAERYARQLCVLFLDLDRFKNVNDRYGHLVGSQVLRQLSQVLRDSIRQVDTLARYGGDEFTILLADSSLEPGLAVAERIRRSVADTLFESGGREPVRLTISIGVAAYPEHGRDRTSLLDAADKAMYRAKSLGRDRVCSAADLERPS